MTEWRIVPDSNVEVSSDGRVRRNGVERMLHPNAYGYLALKVNYKYVLLHRLIAFAFVPNLTEKPCVDHIDGNRLNNCVENLRWATLEENRQNSKNRFRASGLPQGVTSQGDSFHAKLKYGGKDYYLGSYTTPEEASDAYEVRAKELFGEFYRAPIYR